MGARLPSGRRFPPSAAIVSAFAVSFTIAFTASVKDESQELAGKRVRICRSPTATTHSEPAAKSSG
jgi:hypothetical protein